MVRNGVEEGLDEVHATFHGPVKDARPTRVPFGGQTDRTERKRVAVAEGSWRASEKGQLRKPAARSRNSFNVSGHENGENGSLARKSQSLERNSESG